eukprot:14334036-Heterocapsa_arctica.AAC.1
MAPRSAQQRGFPSVDGRVRVTTDEEKYLKKHYLETIVKVTYYTCEAAYQTMRETEACPEVLATLSGDNAHDLVTKFFNL